MEITYSRIGDYLLPDIRLNEPPPELAKPLGRYGMLRQKYLKSHRPITYSTLLLSERLYPQLRDLDEIANERRERGVSDEIILAELVYEWHIMGRASLNRRPVPFCPGFCTHCAGFCTWCCKTRR